MREQIDIAFSGDPEYASGKLWFQYHQDKIGLLFGSSLVTNTLGGFAVHRFWWKGMRKRHGWLVWILGLLAQAPTADAILAFFSSFEELLKEGAAPGHLFHLFGFVTGATLSAYC